MRIETDKQVEIAECIGSADPLPFWHDVPEQDRRLAEEASAEYEWAERQASDARARQAKEIADRARTRVRDAIGADNWVALRRFMTDERQAFSDLWQPPEGLTRDFAEMNRARKEKAEAFLRNVGAASDRLTEIGREFVSHAHGLFTGPADAAIVPGYAISSGITICRRRRNGGGRSPSPGRRIF